MSIRLLFICGGRRVGLLNHFRRALAEHGGGQLYTTDTLPHSAASFVVDRTFAVSPCKDREQFVADVAAVCDELDMTAVLPLRCDAVAAMPALRRRTSVLIIGGDDEAIRICNDKALTAAYFHTVGLRTPEVINNPHGSDLPLFCRPRTGEGSKDSYVVLTKSQLESTRRDDYVFTRYIEGVEYTIDCYKDLRGRLMAVVPRQRLRVRAGEVERAVTRDIGVLRDQAQAALEGLAFTGPAAIQAISSGGEYYFTEINLRYAGGVTLAVTAGADSPSWLVSELHGETPPVPAKLLWNLAMSRYDSEFYYEEEETS